VLDDGTHLSDQALANGLKVRVFNRDYVADNFQEEHTAQAVFIVGERSIALDQRLAILRARLARLEKIERQLRGRKDDVRKSLDAEATSAATHARSVLQDSKFERPRLEKRYQEVVSDPKAHVLTDRELSTRIAALTSTVEYKRLAEPSPGLPDLKALCGGARELLRETASNTALEELRTNPGLAEWTRQGLRLHRDERTCAFCKGALTDERLDELRGHFSEAYENLLARVQALLGRVTQAVARLDIGNTLPDEFLLFPDQQHPYADLRKELLDWVDWARAILETLREQLEKKETAIETSLDFEAPLTRGEEGEAALKKLCGVITKHNDALQDLKSIRDDARRVLELHFAAKHYMDTGVKAKEEEEQRLGDRANKASQVALKTETAIREVETRVDQAAIGAERLNELLSLLLSQSDIEARSIGKSQFRFLRGGEPAVNLSEGEQTAITLAHFLTSLEAGDNKLEDTIVFVDDPMCSLDSNHLYTVYGLLVETLEKCRQAFVSTHSYEFFNLLKSRWTGRRLAKDTCLYYICRSIGSSGAASAELTKLPSLLKKYGSEYHFMFSLLYSFAYAEDPSEHEKYTAPNILRKFLESYLGFRKPGVLAWHEKLDLLFDSPEKARSIHKIADDASHMQRLERSREEPAFLVTVRECVRDVLTALQDKDPCHFDSLVEMVKDAQA